MSRDKMFALDHVGPKQENVAVVILFSIYPLDVNAGIYRTSIMGFVFFRNKKQRPKLFMRAHRCIVVFLASKFLGRREGSFVDELPLSIA